MQTQGRSKRAQPPKALSSGVHPAIKKLKTPPPILASEVLREDLPPSSLAAGHRESGMVGWLPFLWRSGFAFV